MDALISLIKGVVIWVLEVVVGVGVGGSALYLAISLFDKTTKNVEEWKEIKKGNVAVAILMMGIIFSVVLIITPAIKHLLSGLFREEIMSSPAELATVFVINLINLVISLGIAILAVALSFRLVNIITTDIDEEVEIRKGNVAVALITAIVMYSVASFISSTVNQAIVLINQEVINLLLG